MPYEPGEKLFSKVESAQAFEAQRQQIRGDVAALTEAILLGNPIEDILENFVARAEIDPLVLYTDRIEQAEEGEMQDQVFDHSWQSYVSLSLNYYIFAIPFAGDRNLFQVRPSRFFYTVPMGRVYPSELRISFLLRLHQGPEELKNQVNGSIGELKTWVENLRLDVQAFNAALPDFIRDLLNKRKEKLERDRHIRKEIGFPIRPRPDVSSFTPIPLTRKRPLKQLQTRAQQFSTEPDLLDEHYNHILGSLQNMSELIERSPDTYADLSETDIRNILLVSLNNSYEGRATAETFTKKGKSDIFITDQGKCIFIAECKIWTGPASLSGAIDQLLGYATWRNTKTAILLFNKNKRISDVLQKVAPTVEGHAHFKRNLSNGSEKSAFRFVIKNKEDPNIEIQLAVLVFDIPSAKNDEEPSGR